MIFPKVLTTLCWTQPFSKQIHSLLLLTSYPLAHGLPGGINDAMLAKALHGEQRKYSEVVTLMWYLQRYIVDEVIWRSMRIKSSKYFHVVTLE